MYVCMYVYLSKKRKGKKERGKKKGKKKRKEKKRKEKKRKEKEKTPTYTLFLFPVVFPDAYDVTNT